MTKTSSATQQEKHIRCWAQVVFTAYGKGVLLITGSPYAETEFLSRSASISGLLVMDEIVEGMLAQMTYVLTVKMKYSPRDKVDKSNRFVKIVLKKRLKPTLPCVLKKEFKKFKITDLFNIGY